MKLLRMLLCGVMVLNNASAAAAADLRASNTPSEMAAPSPTDDEPDTPSPTDAENSGEASEGFTPAGFPLLELWIADLFLHNPTIVCPTP